MKSGFLIGILFTQLLCYGQYTYKWESKPFSFISPFELEKVASASADNFNWQNDEYTIEISAFGLGYYNTYYPSKTAKQIAHDVAIEQSFYDIVDGDTISGLDNGFYVLAKTPGLEDNQYAAVIVVVGFSEKKKIYIEARIYCFNNKYKKGIEIAKSFSFSK